MRVSPAILSFLYFFAANLFVLFAILHVQMEGWDFIAFMFIAIAAVDYMLTWHHVKRMRSKTSSH
ncbi:DUF4305 domain-containing protein [Geomicrobium sp. JCM 19038]|uniref:DUF4305 domain-containing protein n=1 Tax=Geomicrobium sp. JCM 19038 TaxID=1460635 RepID=UPI00045F29FC|nr:DUF4305 domain-containing protein [Geomicrobium sp. JCM 19038]GAK10095.1 hypothetical protein JCM19038_3977 [Geomicrobium sp. JCM 19038]